MRNSIAFVIIVYSKYFSVKKLSVKFFIFIFFHLESKRLIEFNRKMKKDLYTSQYFLSIFVHSI